MRPIQHRGYKSDRDLNISQLRTYTLRVYDAVGPQTMSFLLMLRTIAAAHGNRFFNPAFIDYRNMELLLNEQSLGNMNRQFISLLRSEQDGSKKPIIGNPEVFTSLLGPNSSLSTLDQSFAECGEVSRKFPLNNLVKWVMRNPKVILPGLAVMRETIGAAVSRKRPPTASITK